MPGTCETIPYMRMENVIFLVKKGRWDGGYPLGFGAKALGPRAEVGYKTVG